MKPGIIYTLQFSTLSVPSSTGGADRSASQDVIISIYDNGTLIPDDDTPQVIELIPGEDPLIIEVVDNDESKFKQIRAKQAKITFISQQDLGIDFSIFARGYDNQFYVTIETSNEHTLFIGYLMLPDAQMPFLPDPNVVELTASDHLALLKDIAIVESTGENISGKYRIAELLSLSLKQTGLSLPINVMNNLRMGTGTRLSSNVTFAASDNSITVDFYIGFFYVGQVVDVVSASNTGTYRVLSIDSSIKIIVDGTIVNETATIYNVQFTDVSSNGHFYDKAYLDAKTFEASIGVSVSCYEVLERILQDDSVLFQYRGEWWIMRIDEYDNFGQYVAKFDADGELIDEPELKDIDFNVGFNDNVLFANANQIVRCDRPHKFVKEQFSYVWPAEIICNLNFERGEVVVPPNMTAPESTGLYDVECWELARLSGSPVNTSFNIKKLFEFGYLKETNLAINPASSTGTPFTFAKPVEGMPILKGDKVSFYFSYKWENKFGSGSGLYTYFPARFWAVDKEGKVWHWWNTSTPFEPDTFFWQDPDIWNTDPFEQYERLYPDQFNITDEDESEYRSISVDLASIPVDATLFIGLNQMRQGGSSSDNQTALFSAVSVTYSPVINGSYEKYTGHTNTVTRVDNGYAAKREEEVNIGDIPRPIFKGGIFFESGGQFSIAQIFYPSSHYGITGNPQPQMTRPYGWHQAFAVWNQYRSAYTILTGDFWGLPEEWPDLLHRFVLTDVHGLTYNRYFILISLTQNWKTGITTGTFVEVYNTDDEKVYDTPWEFKFITDGNN